MRSHFCTWKFDWSFFPLFKRQCCVHIIFMSIFRQVPKKTIFDSWRIFFLQNIFVYSLNVKWPCPHAKTSSKFFSSCVYYFSFSFLFLCGQTLFGLSEITLFICLNACNERTNEMKTKIGSVQKDEVILEWVHSHQKTFSQKSRFAQNH